MQESTLFVIILAHVMMKLCGENLFLEKQDSDEIRFWRNSVSGKTISSFKILKIILSFVFKVHLEQRRAVKSYQLKLLCLGATENT